MTRLSVAASLLCGLLFSIPAAPQQTNGSQAPSPGQPPAQSPTTPVKPDPQTGQQTPKFIVNPTEIIVPVTVTDLKGKYLSNLTINDFRIQDEGRNQKITFFYHDSPGIRQHTVIGFLVDLSNGSLSHWDKFKDATEQMIWGLMPYDKNYQGYLISYNTKAELAQDTTYDPDKLVEKVERMKPGGGAALYDAISRACTDRTLVAGEPYQPRRVIIVVGDGHDTASDYTLDQVIELALRNQVTVYGVSTLTFGSSSDDADNLEKIATATGGHVEYPLVDPYGSTVSGYLSHPSDDGNYALSVGSGAYTQVISQAVNQAVTNLQGEVQTQYILRYTPEIDPSTNYKDKRLIKVDIPTLPAGSVKVFARKYYYSSGTNVTEAKK